MVAPAFFGAGAAAGAGKAGISTSTALGIAGLGFSGLSLFGGGGDQSAAQRQLARNQQILAEQQRAAAELQAGQLEQQAGQSRALSQREAAEQRRRKRLAVSSAQARAAASGAGATDPTVLDIIGDIEELGEFNALSALFEGEDEARGLEFGADVARFQGDAAAFQSNQRAIAARRDAQASRRESFTNLFSRVGGIATGASRFLGSGSGGFTLLEKYG